MRQQLVACTHLDVNSFPLCTSSCCRAGMPETPSRVSCKDATVSSGFTWKTHEGQGKRFPTLVTSAHSPVETVRSYLDLEDLRVKADCDQHCRDKGYVLRPIQVTAVCVGSCHISDSLDDSMESLCMRLFFGLARSSLWSRKVLPSNRLTINCGMLTSACRMGG